MTWPATALLSLSDKTGAIEFARALAARGTRILASGGTAKHLDQAGVPVSPIERWTGFGELLGGRVKTLHPHVHAPILARRGVASDLSELEERSLEPIDLVAVTLYPFETRAGSLDEPAAAEEIDIGGVALLRAAAKNYADVIVVHDPAQYPEVLRELESGGPTLERRRVWGLATFARTARYDAAIAAELARRAGGAGSEEPPPVHVVALERVRPLRYGENPHQVASLHARIGQGARLGAWREDRELSYNNLLDLEAAVSLAWRFDEPASVIVKHGEPCGVACGDRIADAVKEALASDPQSAFGGVVATNRAIDEPAAAHLGSQFVECVAAPDFSPEAEGILKSKKSLRALRLGAEDVASPDRLSVRLVGRWGLIQFEPDRPAPEWRTVTRRAPTADEIGALRFAWKVAAAARSNAIAIARGSALIGLGSGQTSRVDAVDVAIMKARRVGHSLEGAVLASDGFFPFADNIEHAAAAGIRAIVQPGGSKRDAEVIAACDRLDLAMTFTGQRTFRH